MYGKGSRTYNSSDSSYTGTENPLASNADTATQVMGSGWRMPTKSELEDLINKTNYTWVTINGVSGGKFTSKTNPNAYVFFPAAGLHQGGLDGKGSLGFVWSSTPDSSSRHAYRLNFHSENKGMSKDYRYCGFSVRGVHE